PPPGAFAVTSRIRSVAAIAKTPSASVSRRAVSTAASVRPAADASAELGYEPLGVPVLPAALDPAAAGVAVELYERVHETAPYRRAAEQLGQLRVLEEPVGVEARPVGVPAVGDPVDDVVGLGHLVEERAHLLDGGCHQFRLGS